MAARRQLGRGRRSERSHALWWWLLGGGLLLGALAALVIGLVVAGASAVVGVRVASAFLDDLPAVEDISGVGEALFQTTTIYDRHGRPLGELLGPGRRKVVPPDEIPQVVKLAVIASEDATFYENPGVEPRAIVRAVWQNFLGGGVVSGFSTITQQLVKNVLLTPEVTVERKLKEVVLAWQISQRFSKDEILGLYLNQNYYGSLAYGVAAAAETYFGKDLGEVTLAEAAMLVGLLRSPSTANPHIDPEAARREQLRVLSAIERHGFASPERVEEARQETLVVVPPQPLQAAAPHFFNYVLEELQARYGPEISREGWQVITTLDLDLQAAAERIAREQVASLEDRDVSNAALVALRPLTGEILAMLGSVDFNDPLIDGQVNVVTAERQPGSSFKVVTYLAALQKGYTPATMLLDIPTSIPVAGQTPYAPQNYDRRFRGPVSLRTALGSSLNVPAVRVQQFAGLDETVELAHTLGITTLQDRSRIGPALALGSNEVRLLDLTAAYGVLANGGRRVVPTGILCIRDARGRIVEQLGDGCSQRVLGDPAEVPTVPLQERVLNDGLAFLMTSILSDAEARIPSFGTAGEALELEGRPAAAKTGTTEDARDALTVGYTPQLVVGVWVGNSDGHATDGVTGVRGAAPIWKSFMEAALKGQPVLAWAPPQSVVTQEVDVLSGLLPSPYTPQTREEYFLAGTVPTQRDMVHQPFQVHRPSGLLATPDTPPEDVEERVFVILPKEAEAWQRQQAADSPLRLPPEEFVAATGPAAGAVGGAVVIQPAEMAPVRSILEISGTAGGPEFAGFEVHYGAGPAPGTWIRIGFPSSEPTSEGVLAAMDTIQLSDGVYTLRLTVRATTGLEEIVFRRFLVDNTPPTARLVGMTDGAWLPVGMTELAVEVEDAGGVARVEYFIDGRSVGDVKRVPFTLTWTAVSGEHLLVARVIDRAGNQVATEPVRFWVA